MNKIRILGATETTNQVFETTVSGFQKFSSANFQNLFIYFK